MANIPLKTIKFPGLANTYTIPEVSTDLTASGKAAEAAKVGAELATLGDQLDTNTEDIDKLKADLEDVNERLDGLGDGVTTEVRQALLTLFQSAAYAETGLTDEIAVIESWAAVVTAIALNQTSISISGASTNQLVATTTPAGGAVTWASSDTNVATVSNSGLVTGVGNGSCTITASCGGKTATCSVTVSGFASLTGITATYTQAHTLYYDSSISDILPDLVVVANYSDSSTITLPSDQYAVTGVFSEGTATFTVTYREFSTTFNASVTAVLYPLAQGTHTFSDGSYVTVVNNHVKCYAASAYNGSTGYQFNFLDINDNTTTSKTSSDNANNKSSKFTIPSGETCVINLSIKSNSGFYKANTSTVFVVGNREANGTGNLGTATYFGGATNWETDQNGYVVPSDYSNQFTLEQSKNCGAYYFYNGHADEGATIEFDVQLFVGDDRYF